MNPTLSLNQRRTRLASVGIFILHGITSFAAPGGPAPQVPDGAAAPGVFPNGSVSSVNVLAKGSAEAFDARVEITGFDGQGPIPWSINRYNRGDFSLRLSPGDPAVALESLNLGFREYAETSVGLAANQAWRPHPALGVVIPTARQNGPIDWADGTEPFYPTIAISQSSSGPGYNMVDGSFGNGELDINTGRAGTGANGEANFAFSVTWFPYDQGWIGGEFGNPGPAGEGVWRQPTSHATGVTEGMLRWIENPAGSGTFGGSATLRLPGVNSLTDGMLFASSSEGSSTLNIIGVAPAAEGAGWHITVREDEAADAETLAVPSQSPFQWVYIPWSTERLLGGYISGSDASKLSSKGDFTVTRSAEGVYELIVPGKTATSGTLILQPAAFEPETSVPLATRAFLSYEWSGDKMVIKSFVTTGDVTVAPRDVDFYFAWIDFASPLTPPSSVRLRNLPAAQVTPSEVEGVAAVFKEACVAINTDEPEILVTTIDERNVGGHLDPITGEVATSAVVGYFYNPVTLTPTRGPFVILGNTSGILNRHDAKYNPVSKQYVVAANARTYAGANGRAIPLIALVNPASVAGETSPVAKAFFYRETTETDFDDVSLAVSTKNGNFLLGAELKITGEGEGAVGALFDKTGALLTPEYARLDRLQFNGDEDDPDVVYLPKKDVFLYVVNTDVTGGLVNRVVGSIIQTVPNQAGELQVMDEQVIGDASPASTAEGHPASLENPLNGQIITAYDLGGNSVAAGDLAFTTIGDAPSYSFTPARPETPYLTGSGGNPFQHNHPQLDVDPVHGVILVGMAAYGSSQGNPTAYTVQAFNLEGDLLGAPYAAPFFVADAPGGNSGSANYQNLKYSPQSGSFIAVYNNGTAATFITSVSVTSDHAASSPAPSLLVSRSGANVVITWPTTASGFVLESTDSLSAVNWTAVAAAVGEEGALKKVEVPAAGAAKFYRLRN
jgi:hypothetical protein